MKKHKIIDFHTHLFISTEENVCKQKLHIDMSLEKTVAMFETFGIERVCGSVCSTLPLKQTESWWDRTKRLNRIALKLKEKLRDFYIPGFHINPEFLNESIKEIDEMSKQGVYLIGELVPSCMGINYEHKNMNTLIEYATEKGMIISLHTMQNDVMDKLIENNKDAIIVCAHPGQPDVLQAHIDRMKKYENCYIDISGAGISRYGTLRRLINEVGIERILYGSDYPACNPACFVGGVVLDESLTEKEKEYILYKNAKRLLKL